MIAGPPRRGRGTGNGERGTRNEERGRGKGPPEAVEQRANLRSGRDATGARGEKVGRGIAGRVRRGLLGLLGPDRANEGTLLALDFSP